MPRITVLVVVAVRRVEVTSMRPGRNAPDNPSRYSGASCGQPTTSMRPGRNAPDNQGMGRLYEEVVQTSMRPGRNAPDNH